MSIIEFKNASIGYGATPILKNVSCAIERGEAVGLVGPNGAGKTTFLRSILGRLPQKIKDLMVDRTLKFSYVPQIDEINLLWPLTIEEVVALSLRSKRLFGRIDDADRAQLESSMKKTGVYSVRALPFASASGGQRQKAILAQALCQKPDVLLLDEPTKGLDVVAERDFLELIEELRGDSNLTILIVTHSLQIPVNYTEKILLFDKGTVIATTPKEIIHTDLLKRIYGINFSQKEHDGQRFIAAKRSK